MPRTRDNRALFARAYEQAAREAEVDGMPALARLARESADRIWENIREEPCLNS